MDIRKMVKTAWLGVGIVLAMAGAAGAEEAEDVIEIKVEREVLHPISPLLFGQFMEDAGHDGRNAEWGPQAAVAEGGDGELTEAAMARLAELHAPVIRFPGGFMVERYGDAFDYRAWLPGPIEGLWLEEAKPVGFERRAFGLVAFFDACDALRATPLVVVPVKPVFTGEWTVAQAAEFAAGLVAFANGRTPDAVPEAYRPWVEARIAAGRVMPAGATYWQIGNEVWLEKNRLQRRWREQAEEQGVEPASVNPLADDAAWFELQLELVNAMSEAMRAVDPRIQLITDGMLGGDYNVRLAELEPGVEMLSDHRYMPWGTDGTVQLGAGDDAETIAVEDLTPEEHFRALVSVPGLDEAGRSLWRYDRDNDLHGKPMAFTEWNWNGWGDSVNGHPVVRAEWAQGVGTAGFLHGIMRRGDRAVIANQSMMIGDRWDIAGVRVGEDHEPFVKPTGRVTGFYSRHHGTDMLTIDDADVPRYEQPYRMKSIAPQPRVALIDALATASLRRVYVHLIHRSYDTPHEVAIDLSDVVAEDATEAELRLLLGRTDVDLGDPDFAGALVEVATPVSIEDGVARFELPAQAVGVLIAAADESVVGDRLDVERQLRGMERRLRESDEPIGD